MISTLNPQALDVHAESLHKLRIDVFAAIEAVTSGSFALDDAQPLHEILDWLMAATEVLARELEAFASIIRAELTKHLGPAPQSVDRPHWARWHRVSFSDSHEEQHSHR